ncbi:MAG TPA: hypothetical protein VK914_09850 [bacterium]|nr:hypothetical protein [bacterium]
MAFYEAQKGRPVTVGQWVKNPGWPDQKVKVQDNQARQKECPETTQIYPRAFSQSVILLIQNLRIVSTARITVWACLSTSVICPSVNFDLFEGIVSNETVQKI